MSACWRARATGSGGSSPCMSRGCMHMKTVSIPIETEVS